jgi:phosphonate transport system ATP-binding protein
LAQIEIKNLEKVYDNGVHALRGVSLKVNKGEFLAVIGLSGSGKSTLLRCMNGLIQPTSGQVIFNGVDITKLSEKEIRQQRKKIGMIFQHFNLIPRKSVLVNALTGTLGDMPTLASIFQKYPSDKVKLALEKLALVGLGEKAEQRADHLSGGQQQRVAIARALMQNPEVLLADEPVASLDPATSHTVMDYLEAANKKMGMTVVCNLHFLSLVRRYATRVVALKGGELVYEGQPSDIDEAWFARIYGDQAKEVQIR